MGSMSNSVGPDERGWHDEHSGWGGQATEGLGMQVGGVRQWAQRDRRASNGGLTLGRKQLLGLRGGNLGLKDVLQP